MSCHFTSNIVTQRHVLSQQLPYWSRKDWRIDSWWFQFQLSFRPMQWWFSHITYPSQFPFYIFAWFCLRPHVWHLIFLALFKQVESLCYHIIIHFPNHFGDGSTTHWPSCTLFVQVPEQSVETLRPLALTALGVAETFLELMLGLIKMIGFPSTNPSYFVVIRMVLESVSMDLWDRSGASLAGKIPNLLHQAVHFCWRRGVMGRGTEWRTDVEMFLQGLPRTQHGVVGQHIMWWYDALILSPLIWKAPLSIGSIPPESE